MGAAFARRRRGRLRRRRAGPVAAGGCTSRAAVAALLETGVPFILGFARSKPIRARLAAPGGRPGRRPRGGGAVGLGACPRDARRRLFALGPRAPTDQRGPWLDVTRLTAAGPQRLAATYRHRGRGEQAIEELSNGADLDHLVGSALPPTRVAIGCRPLARHLAIGLPIRDADARPPVIREPAAFRAAHVDGLGTFVCAGRSSLLTRPHPAPAAPSALPWTDRTVRLVA